MAYNEHLQQEIGFQGFTEEQELSHESTRDMQQQHRVPPTWLMNNNAAGTHHHRQQQNFLHLQAEKSMSNSESEDLGEYKADILGHPLYDQLLSAHVSCLRIATPVDQLPRIDAQLQQSQRVVHKYSSLANGVVDQKELDHFMVSLFLSLLLLLLFTSYDY